MGMTDNELALRYAPIVSELLKKVPENGRVAWLGQKHPKYKTDLVIYNPSVENIDREDLTHDFYDIKNDHGEKCFKWDVHERWQISGYDLVLGLRVLYLCEKRSVLMKNLTEITQNNTKVVFDFMSGNPRIEGDTVYLEKKNNSKTILPMLNQFYPKDKKYLPTVVHADQTVWLGDFTRSQPGAPGVNLGLNNILTFKDVTKGRFYSLCEVLCNTKDKQQ